MFFWTFSWRRERSTFTKKHKVNVKENFLFFKYGVDTIKNVVRHTNWICCDGSLIGITKCFNFIFFFFLEKIFYLDWFDRKWWIDNKSVIFRKIKQHKTWINPKRNRNTKMRIFAIAQFKTKKNKFRTQTIKQQRHSKSICKRAKLKQFFLFQYMFEVFMQ